MTSFEQNSQQKQRKQHCKRQQSVLTFRVTIAFLVLSLATVSHAFVESPIASRASPLHQASQRSAPLALSPLKKNNANLLRPQEKNNMALNASIEQFWKVDPKGMAADYPDTRARFIAGILATIFTWHGITVNGLNPVMASSATTLAISLWSPGLGQAAFCGSFAGMNANGSWGMMLTAASLTAASFEVLIHRGNKWVGLGGKLSFQAFMASNLTALLFGKATFGWISRLPTTLPALWSVVKASPIGYGMLCGALGSVLTIFLREIAEYNPNRDNDLQDPIRSSAVIGILAAMAMGMGGFLDDYGAMIMFGGAFTGMSYPSRLLKGKGGGTNLKRSDPTALQTLIWFGVAGAFGGLIHALSLTLKLWTGGWGGKAGTCAFAGGCLFRVCERIHYKVRQRMGWVDKPINGSAPSEGSADGESPSSANGSSATAAVSN
mmetsp:Transcript_44299/g.106719  ORF Transcript_44299/g.106719 Transcript_44299/m.106719 type:complete len:436 (+) Transcript_44299:152-1459(+)|eukprot:CAMPEP_0113623022 /NCGR_PEP_ID=MMETSP0017_2-20120614/11831_1 /TAXON_ID=2856 /ORGANISM="Cylindrotheca closterium" /LENGTH=435 /DNA_ID=CAMNT_0000532935 /DNA_START=118 /DNA_END=1425 /DNA_ORIENTATION=+ /assembly_acc=CAM_ASM_000147